MGYLVTSVQVQEVPPDGHGRGLGTHRRGGPFRRNRCRRTVPGMTSEDKTFVECRRLGAEGDRGWRGRVRDMGV